MKVLSGHKLCFYLEYAVIALLFCMSPLSATTISSINVGEAADAFDRRAFAENLEAQLNANNMQAALDLFETLPESEAADFDLKMLHASLLLSAGDTKGAEPIAKELLAQQPKNTDVLTLNIMLAKAKGDSATKSKMIKQLLAIDPNNSDANTELGAEQVLRHNYKLANTYYAKALKGDSSNMEALFGMGQTSYYLGRIADSKRYFNIMLKAQPDNATAYYYLGKLAAEESNYLAAVEYIEKAISLDGANTDFYLDYGNYLRFRGNFKGAEAAWTKAIELDPNYFLAYAYRAGLYDEQNIFDKALSDYRMVIKTNPKYYFAFESLGIIAWHEEQWAEAREAFIKARELNDDNISYPLMIAACYYKEGKKMEAKKFLEGVLKNLRNKQQMAKNTADKDRYAAEYDVARLYSDLSGEQPIIQRVRKIQNSNRRGKLLFYLGLYCDIVTNGKLASADFYTDVINMNSPMFFEYRLAEWAVGKNQ